MCLQQWRELYGRITDASDEAKDNLKFLYSIERLCQPLYVSDPTTMLDSLPALINTIQMVHAVSRYYHTSERMTSLFVKVKIAYAHIMLILVIKVPVPVLSPCRLSYHLLLFVNY